MLIKSQTKAFFTKCSFLNSRVYYDKQSYAITGGAAIAIVEGSQAEFTNCVFEGNHAVKRASTTTTSALSLLKVSVEWTRVSRPPFEPAQTCLIQFQALQSETKLIRNTLY
jgi:hypothetical protein